MAKLWLALACISAFLCGVSAVNNAPICWLFAGLWLAFGLLYVVSEEHYN